MVKRQISESCKDIEEVTRQMFFSPGVCIWPSSEAGRGTDWTFGLWDSSCILSSCHAQRCILTVWSNLDLMTCISCWGTSKFHGLWRRAKKAELLVSVRGQHRGRSVSEEGARATVWWKVLNNCVVFWFYTLRLLARCPDRESFETSLITTVKYFLPCYLFHAS